VHDLQIGDRVGVPWIHWSCVSANFAMKETKTCAGRQKITGVTVDGGYAEFVKAPGNSRAEIPDGLSCARSRPAFLVLDSQFIGALKGAGIVRGQRLAVFRHRRPGTPCSAVRTGLWRGGDRDRTFPRRSLNSPDHPVAPPTRSTLTTTDAAKQLRRKGGNPRVHLLLPAAKGSLLHTAFFLPPARRYSARRGLAR